MSNFIYSKMGGKNDALFGKFEYPIKALIESESDNWEKKKTALDLLFNIEKSNRFAETIIGESDFGDFQAAKEGQGAENDSIETTYKKTIEHIAFMKEFTITKEMADDAKFGMGSNMKAKPRKFVDSYYRTRVRVGTQALINGTSTSVTINKATVDLTAPDGLSLFNKAHTFSTDKMKSTTQSNYFYGDLTSTSAKLEKALALTANKMRNFKDENGETIGYVPDILVVPCNRPDLEMMIKKIVGSERTTGTDYNDINTQYGNWTICVLDGWETTDDRFMCMSSEANKNLFGNMFYNRVPLDIQSDVDLHTRNYFWNGYCRFGVGFGSWKHISLCVNSTSAVADATELK